MMLLRLAYRNLWRNRRRTLITAASILFAVFFAVVLRSIQKGGWDHMVDSVVHFYFGYAQIHSKGYWEDQSLDKAFPYPDESLDIETRNTGIEIFVPRLESFALASHKQSTRGVMLVGIDPEKENALTNITERIEEGKKEIREGAVVIAEGLASYLNLGVGDTIVFISQGYRGTNAAGKYPISGLVNFGSPELNDRIAYLPLRDAQNFYRADGLVTSLVIGLEDRDDLPNAMNYLRTSVDTTRYEIMDYEELLPELMEAREFDEAGGVIILFILYAIITFGIFGTLLMMLKEREYEFGILKAIGMKSRQILVVLWFEITTLSLIGAIAGMLVALPVVGYLTVHPIRFTGDMAEAYEKFGVTPVLPATIEFPIFFQQAVIVVILVSCMFIYALFKIHKLKPMKALRH